MFADRYLVTIDGSEYFNSESISCSHCLTRHKSNDHVEHYHQVLQPALVHPDRSQVIPLAPEFIRRQDGANKQDCEVVAGLRRGKMLDRCERTRADRSRLVYEWVHDTPLFGTDEAPKVNYVEFHLYDAGGKRTRHFSWVTDLAISEENVEEFVRAARSRWKIENENFNTLKNHLTPPPDRRSLRHPLPFPNTCAKSRHVLPCVPSDRN